MNDTTPQQPGEGGPSGAAEGPAKPPAEPTQAMAAAPPPAPGPGGPPPPGASPPPGSPPPVPPPGSPPPAGAPPPAGTQVAWGGTGGPPPPRRPSLWHEAVSTTGGKIAIGTAAVAVVLVGLLVAGLVIGAIVRHAAVDRVFGPYQDGRSVPQLPRDRVLPPGMGKGGGRADDGLPRLGLGGVSHGEFTVTQPDGTQRTLTIQRGTATQVSSTAITVRSSDNYTATYTINSGTTRMPGRALTTGDSVLVIGDKDTKAALRIQRGGVPD